MQKSYGGYWGNAQWGKWKDGKGGEFLEMALVFNLL